MLQALSGSGSVQGMSIINIRCPRCRHQGAFHGLAGTQDASWANARETASGRHAITNYRVGVRQCPNPDCRAVVFVEFKEKDVLETYPPQVIDFDSTSLPSKVLNSLEEAIKCHSAGCFRASALMVRKTLEDLCEDKQVTGQNLKQRVANLRGAIVISEDLLQAADELRLLGNDAAHVEAQAYDAIEAEEVEVAIELTKELLKAVYQHTSLVARLRALKISPTKP